MSKNLPAQPYGGCGAVSGRKTKKGGDDALRAARSASARATLTASPVLFAGHDGCDARNE